MELWHIEHRGNVIVSVSDTHKGLNGNNRCKFTYNFTLKVFSFEFECWESNRGQHVDSQGEIREKSGKSMLEFWQTP